MNTLALISLTQLPRELIYKIAAADAGVYNRIIRLCRYTISLFPLSIRLDVMEAFGVRVKIHKYDEVDASCITWYWNDQLHDIFGPAESWEDDSIAHYYRGVIHAVDTPAYIHRDNIGWYSHDCRYRDPEAPAGTGVKWLAGASVVISSSEYILATWYNNRDIPIRRIRALPGTVEYAQASAEINYWFTRECQ
jgi:hypothetical protein